MRFHVANSVSDEGTSEVGEPHLTRRFPIMSLDAFNLIGHQQAGSVVESFPYEFLTEQFIPTLIGCLPELLKDFEERF